MKTSQIFLIPLLILFLSLNLYSDESLRIAVMNFTGNADPDIIRNIQNLYVYNLYNRNSGNDFIILEREKIELVLREKNIKIKAADKVNHNVTIGKTIAADYIIVGNVGKKQDETLQVSARIINIESEEVTFSYNEEAEGMNNIQEIVDRMAMNTFEDIRSIGEMQFLFRSSASVIVPLRIFNDLTNAGYGMTFEAGIKDLFETPIAVTLDLGYYYFQSDKDTVTDISIIPVNINVYYDISLNNYFSIWPVLSVGGAFLQVNKDREKSQAFEPMVQAGLYGNYLFNRDCFFSLGCRYGIVIEQSGIVDMIILSASFTFIY